MEIENFTLVLVALILMTNFLILLSSLHFGGVHDMLFLSVTNNLRTVLEICQTAKLY